MFDITIKQKAPCRMRGYKRRNAKGRSLEIRCRLTKENNKCDIAMTKLNQMDSTRCCVRTAVGLGIFWWTFLRGFCCCFLRFNLSNNRIDLRFFKLPQPLVFCHHSNFYVLPPTLNNLVPGNA
ncbi:hypothetical protein OIU84_009419 [Salix udensis]|uniref:Uncharacterized protein n=1 Tax=Salix udensis TaxID=889485 RepID=A0AAD6JRK6_9ROSI|nr:hypothetical protein OIU84_009419 [Salix udensis]